MFTEKDYLDYFCIIEDKEQEMIDFVRKAISRLEDDNILAVMEFLLKEETRHRKLSEDLVRLFSAS